MWQFFLRLIFSSNSQIAYLFVTELFIKYNITYNNTIIQYMKHITVADPKTLPVLDSCIIRKLLALTFGDSRQKNCNFSVIEYLCCLKNRVETTQSIKGDTPTKSNTWFFFLSGFSFTAIHESQDCRGRERVFL